MKKLLLVTLLTGNVMSIFAQLAERKFIAPSDVYQTFSFRTYNDMELLYFPFNVLSHMSVDVENVLKYMGLLELKVYDSHLDDLKEYTPDFSRLGEASDSYYGNIEKSLRRNVDQHWSDGAKWKYKMDVESLMGGGVYKWKGETDQVKTYKEYVNSDDFKTLRNWAGTVFQGNEKVVYVVSSIRIGQYSFAKQGYPIKVNTPGYGHFLPAYLGKKNLIFRYKPTQPFEVQLQTNRNSVFLKMSEAEAEKFENWLMENKLSKPRTLKAFFQIKINLSEIRGTPNTALAPKKFINYSYSDSKIDVFLGDVPQKPFFIIDLEKGELTYE